MTDLQRRQFLRGLAGWITIASVPWVSGCRKTNSLVIATNPWIGYETLYIARDLNWLPEWVELRDLGTASKSLDMLASGEVNAACLTLDEMLLGRSRGLPLSIALLFDASAGGDMVLVKPSIHGLGDLSGKRIGYERSGVGALIFQQLLAAANLPRSAVIELELPPADQQEAWMRDDVDVVITFEPEATRIRRAGGRRFFDSRQMPNMIFDVLAIHRDNAPSQSLIREVAEAHFRALRHMNTNIDDTIYRVADRLGLSLAEGEIALQGLSRPSLAANHFMLTGQDGTIVKAAARISELMHKEKLLPKHDAATDLVMPNTLPDKMTLPP